LELLAATLFVSGQKHAKVIEWGFVGFRGMASEQQAKISDGDFFRSPEERPGGVEKAAGRGAGAVEGKARTGDETDFASTDPVLAGMHPGEETD
jgi:hypothetical protein